jgi:hypothetical protein
VYENALDPASKVRYGITRMALTADEAESEAGTAGVDI